MLHCLNYSSVDFYNVYSIFLTFTWKIKISTSPGFWLLNNAKHNVLEKQNIVYWQVEQD